MKTSNSGYRTGPPTCPQARDRAQVLLSEVNHRVANSLALVSSLVTLQSKALGDATAKKALAETQDRIFAIALVHRRLYGSNDVRVVKLDEYLTGLLDHLRTSLRGDEQGPVLSYELEPVLLGDRRQRQSRRGGDRMGHQCVQIRLPRGWRRNPGSPAAASRTSSWSWWSRDDGNRPGGGRPGQGAPGWGLRIVTAMASSLGATIDYRSRTPGLSAQLVFPANSQAAAAQ